MDSKLQIISGTFRGRKLNLPPNGRPTQNRARIALFNMISSLGVRPKVVWDAFAGSGAFGIECLSRYPECRAVFTDVAPATVRKNLAAVGADTRATAIGGDALEMVARCGAAADLIFVDPPYAAAATGAKFVENLGRVAAPGAVLIWEQDGANAAAPHDDVWEILRDKSYGRARFLIMRRRAQ